jgi:AcrR family transcriptional regulator
MRLMNAGVTVFSHRGFHATRVDDIVKVAKTSHGTFYLYFSSKEDMFDQLVAEVVEEFDRLTDGLPRISDNEAGRASLEEWLASFVEVYRGYGPLIRSWTDAEGPRDGDGPRVPDLLGSIAAELTSRIRVRSSKAFDPAVAALAVVAMVERVNYFLAADQVHDDASRLVEVLAAIILDAFFGPGH